MQLFSNYFNCPLISRTTVRTKQKIATKPTIVKKSQPLFKPIRVKNKPHNNKIVAKKKINRRIIKVFNCLTFDKGMKTLLIKQISYDIFSN